MNQFEIGFNFSVITFCAATLIMVAIRSEVNGASGLFVLFGSFVIGFMLASVIRKIKKGDSSGK